MYEKATQGFVFTFLTVLSCEATLTAKTKSLHRGRKHWFKWGKKGKGGRKNKGEQNSLESHASDHMVISLFTFFPQESTANPTAAIHPMEAFRCSSPAEGPAPFPNPSLSSPSVS